MRYFRGKWLIQSDFVVAVVSLDGEEILGGSGFHLREGELSSGNAEIGMWIRADAAGCGLGTRVLVEMLRWGFDEWPFERLSWRCSRENRGSLRVAEKAGMTREGTLHGHRVEDDGSRGDTLLFSALRASWTPPESE